MRKVAILLVLMVYVASPSLATAFEIYDNATQTPMPGVAIYAGSETEIAVGNRSCITNIQGRCNIELPGWQRTSIYIPSSNVYSGIWTEEDILPNITVRYSIINKRLSVRAVESESVPAFDLAIVVDASGSMGSADYPPSRIEAAKAAAFELVKMLSALDRVAVIGFSHVSTTYQNLTQDYSSLNSSIGRMMAAGSTCMGCGLGDAYKVLSSSPTAAAILLSDGCSNTGADPLSFASNFSSRRIKIFAIGIGDRSDVCENLLMNLSSSTGGKYYFSPTKANLEQLFSELGLETKGVNVTAGNKTCLSSELYSDVGYELKGTMKLNSKKISRSCETPCSLCQLDFDLYNATFDAEGHKSMALKVYLPPEAGVHFNITLFSLPYLVVRSNVDEASVNVNKSHKGSLSGGRLSIPLERFGNYTVELFKKGYRKNSTGVEIPKEREAYIHLAEAKGLHEFKIKTNVEKVDVRYDNQRACATEKPLLNPSCWFGSCDFECTIRDLAEGTYTLTGKKEGYKDASVDVRIPEEKEARLELESAVPKFRIVFVPVGFGPYLNPDKGLDILAKEEKILDDFRSKTPFSDCKPRIESFEVKPWTCNFKCTDLCGDCIDISLSCIKDNLDIPFDKAVAIVNPDSLVNLTDQNRDMKGCAGAGIFGYIGSATLSDAPDWIFQHEIGHNLGLGHLRSGVNSSAKPCEPSYPNYEDCNNILEPFSIMNYLNLPDFLKWHGPAGYNFMKNNYTDWNFEWTYNDMRKNYTNFVGLNKWVNVCSN